MKWEVVLIQRRVGLEGKPNLEFVEPRGSDLDKVNGSSRLTSPAALSQQIPRGIETAKLVNFGFSTWADLYPVRQLEVLLRATRLLYGMKLRPAIHDRLALCLAGAGEMPGHVCRWDRFHPKVFEGLANHRFSLDGLAVEPNPIAEVGRGCLEHRIAASVAAARCLVEIAPAGFRTRYVRTGRSNRRASVQSAAATIVQGSSERLLLKDSCVDLILTDPPYYDCVQYGELSSLFLGWTQALGISRLAGRLVRKAEVVPNRFRSEGAESYRRKLGRIFKECARTIRDNGRLVLTFHCRDLRAWSALGRAITDSGFKIASLAVMETENGKDHAKRGKNAFLSDLLIECVKSASSTGECEIVGGRRTSEQRELLHVGAALVEIGSGSYEELRAEFLRRVRHMKNRKIVTPKLSKGKAVRR